MDPDPVTMEVHVREHSGSEPLIHWAGKDRDLEDLDATLPAVVNPAEVRERSVRLMYQDEARFGRMARPRRCWAPLPWRPVMLNGYERQFVYVYGAVSPLQGELDWMLCTEMNTIRMGEFLSQVSHAHPEDFIVMILDDASSHKAKNLPVPENIRLVPLRRTRPNSTRRNMCGMNCARRSFPTVCSITSTRWSHSCAPDCRDWRTIMAGCGALPRGRG